MKMTGPFATALHGVQSLKRSCLIMDSGVLSSIIVLFKVLINGHDRQNLTASWGKRFSVQAAGFCDAIFCNNNNNKSLFQANH